MFPLLVLNFIDQLLITPPPLSLLIEKFQMMLTPPKLCIDVIYQPFITMETLYNYLREIRKKIINLEHVTYARVRTFNVFLGCSANKIQTWPWYFVEQSAIEVINSFIAELLIPLFCNSISWQRSSFSCSEQLFKYAAVSEPLRASLHFKFEDVKISGNSDDIDKADFLLTQYIFMLLAHLPS